jgi:hypothetical protein
VVLWLLPLGSWGEENYRMIKKYLLVIFLKCRVYIESIYILNESTSSSMKTRKVRGRTVVQAEFEAHFARAISLVIKISLKSI